MTHRVWCVTAALAGALPVSFTSASAQASGALDIVGTVVEYDGFLVSGAGALSPWFRYNAGGFTLGGQGTWVTFESGNEIVEGDVAAGWLGPNWGGWRLEASGTLGLAQYSEASGTGHLLVRTRVHRQGARGGGWAGVSTGVSGNDAGGVRQIDAGAWHLQRQWTLVGTATATWIGRHRYLDVIGSASWRGNRTTIDILVGARALSSAAGTAAGDPRREAFAEATARIRLTGHIEALIAAGHSAGDPVRSSLGSDYVSLGVRLNFVRSRRTTPTIVTEALERSLRSIRESPDGSQALVHVGADGTLRILMEGASRVEVMADFTDWTPTRLRRLPSGEWELPLRLSPGAYRLNVRIDGGPWAVPLGTRLEQTEFGGATGVIVIR